MKIEKIVMLAITVVMLLSSVATASSIYISSVQFDVPGKDTKENMNEEWVKITNSGSSAIDMTYWKLLDAENHGNNRLPFHNLVLYPGQTVAVHTGDGDVSDTDRYLEYGTHIWNNPEDGGDTAILKDENGNIIDQKTCNKAYCNFEMLADIDNDNKITVADALLYLRYSVGQDTSPFKITIEDDVTCDNKLTTADALKVLRKAVGQDVNLVCQ